MSGAADLVRLLTLWMLTAQSPRRRWKDCRTTGKCRVAQVLKTALCSRAVLDYSSVRQNSQTMPFMTGALSIHQRSETALVRNCPGVSGTVPAGSTRLREWISRDLSHTSRRALKRPPRLHQLQLGMSITQLVLDGMASLAKLNTAGLQKHHTHVCDGIPKLRIK